MISRNQVSLLKARVVVRSLSPHTPRHCMQMTRLWIVLGEIPMLRKSSIGFQILLIFKFSYKAIDFTVESSYMCVSPSSFPPFPPIDPSDWFLSFSQTVPFLLSCHMYVLHYSVDPLPEDSFIPSHETLASFVSHTHTYHIPQTAYTHHDTTHTLIYIH